LIGRQWLEKKLPLNDTVVFMSSRGSFELVQKVLAAGGSVLATVGAPSSLAVEFASDRGLTLIGFVRDDHFNVYTGEWRVD
jgi:FdhD protein